MPNIVYIATSLDGYIAAEDGNLDWLTSIPNPDEDDYGFGAFMERVDAIIMGRNTFETVLSFGVWPYTKPVFVLSNTLTELPEGFDEDASLVNGDLGELLDRLNDQELETLYIDGGQTIRNFLALDLIDEMYITTVPVLLGKGIPLFGDTPYQLTFEHEATVLHGNQLVMSHFIRT